MIPNAFSNVNEINLIPKILLKQSRGKTALRNLKSEVYEKRNLCK